MQKQSYGSTSLTPDGGSDDDDENYDEEPMTLEEKARLYDMQDKAARRLSVRLMNASSEGDQDRILRESLNLSHHNKKARPLAAKASTQVGTMVCLGLLLLCGLAGLIMLGVTVVGPPNQPIGPYQLLERHEGPEFFDFYTFYEGRDSAGSNGFNTYVGEGRAKELNIVNVSMEKDVLDIYFHGRRKLQENTTTTKNATSVNITDEELDAAISAQNKLVSNNSVIENEEELIDANPDLKDEPFIYMGSEATDSGPRESIRLEGKRRFNRGLFILDLRHMPAGCGVWPAFWLTDEANWPVNGEIDIVEGVNYQSVAKTALHTTKGCSMDDVPQGVKSGGWDEAVGIPDRATGIPDMTLRYATNCFVYDPRQWLNQGCVAVDTDGGSIGIPLNHKGGGVYVLEWDPIYKHIRSWVFSPHTKVPENLRETISTASEADPNDRVKPDPDLWPLPYGYFPVGDSTDCPASHFKNMRLVFNLAFCGSVAGNRFQMDCPLQAKKFETCNDWLKAEPEELKEAYWKIRGVYVYQREWERAWL